MIATGRPNVANSMADQPDTSYMDNIISNATPASNCPTENKTKTSVSSFHLNCQCIFAFALNMLCPNFVNRGAVKQVIAKDVKQRPKILESKTLAWHC